MRRARTSIVGGACYVTVSTYSNSYIHVHVVLQLYMLIRSRGAACIASMARSILHMHVMHDACVRAARIECLHAYASHRGGGVVDGAALLPWRARGTLRARGVQRDPRYYYQEHQASMRLQCALGLVLQSAAAVGALQNNLSLTPSMG